VKTKFDLWMRAQKSRPEGGNFVDLHLPRTYEIILSGSQHASH
jgi:hypothetical protein